MSENLGFALDAGWQVLLVGLVLGAGLPAVFALGVRALVPATAGGAPGGGSASMTPAVGDSAPPVGAGRRLVAGLCFALVLLAVALGIAVIVASGFGREVSFEHVFPTFVPKD